MRPTEFDIVPAACENPLAEGSNPFGHSTCKKRQTVYTNLAFLFCALRDEPGGHGRNVFFRLDFLSQCCTAADDVLY